MTRRMHTVRTTRRPWEEIQVDDATLLDLTRAGQLVPLDPEIADAICRMCTRPYSPDHDSAAPGPTVRHPFIPAAEPKPGEAPETPPKPRRRRTPKRQ